MRICSSRDAALLLAVLSCFVITIHALCSTRQLDLTRLQRALDTCRKHATSPSPVPEPHRALPTVAPASGPRRTVTRRVLVTANSQRPRILTAPSATLLPPPASVTSGWIMVSEEKRHGSDVVVDADDEAPSRSRTWIGRRFPRSFMQTSQASSASLQVNEAAAAWDVGAHDKKCVFHCAFVELGLMDDEGKTNSEQLKRVLEGAARSPELRKRAAELADLCMFKMLHVSTIDATQLECDYPLMLTRCILGRLSKHCEEEETARKRHQLTAVHPDVELLDFS